jgi:hypothetical protein
VTEDIVLGGHGCLLERPVDARWLYVLAHGAGAGMRHAFMHELAHALAARDIATLRYEFPAMSAGKPRPDPPAVCAATVREVVTAAAARWPELAVIAGGKSMGGRMTSQAHAAAPLPRVRGLCFVCFPLHPPAKPGERPSIARAAHLADAPGPMLFLSGTRDALADLALLTPVVAHLGSRARLHVVDGADHGFAVLVRSGRTHAEVMAELASAIAAWTATLA